MRRLLASNLSAWLALIIPLYLVSKGAVLAIRELVFAVVQLALHRSDVRITVAAGSVSNLVHKPTHQSPQTSNLSQAHYVMMLIAEKNSNAPGEWVPGEA
jgi:hypothetical protein